LVSHIKGRTEAGDIHEQGAEEAIIGGWNKLHNEELHGLYSSNIIQKIRWEEHMACTGRRETHAGLW
jgi:hypothetical protein